jgi:beta-mannosidase
MKIAIEAHRRAKPYCMGTLFWQLNDCWPVTSWSSIDYYGNKKAVYYQVKKTFAPLLISFVERKDTLEIHFISDQTETSLTTVKCKLLDFYGNRLEALSFNLSLESNGYVLFWPINKFNLNDNNKNKVVVNVQMVNENDTIEANYYFVKPKDLLLLEPKIKLELQANNVLEISSNVLAKDLYLCLPNAELEASDNYLDILPNQKVRIQLNKGNIDLSKIKTKTLYDIQSAKQK